MSTTSAQIETLSSIAVPEESSRIGYRRDFDGIRAIAVLSVIAFHSRLLPGTGGVDMFFVLSGFLISRNILRALQLKRFSFGEFYARRIRRLFPALIVMFAVTSIFGWLMFLPDEYEQLGKNILAGTAFVQNISFANDPPADNNGPVFILIHHIWSLGVEEQFYLVWPLFLLFIWRFTKRPVFAMLTATALSFALNALELARDHLWESYLLTSCRLWELSLGALWAYAQLRLSQGRAAGSSSTPSGILYRHSGNVQCTIGAGLIIAWFSGLTADYSNREWLILAPTLGTVLLISAGPDSWLNRYVLGSIPLVLVGTVSYELYIWHQPLLIIFEQFKWPGENSLVAKIVAVAIAFPLAVLTYKYVASPMQRSTRKAQMTAILCVGMAACGLIGYLVYRGIIRPRSDSAAYSSITAAQEESSPPEQARAFFRSTPNVSLSVGSGSRRVLFLGDESMQQYYPRIARLLMDHPDNTLSAVFSLRVGCSFAITAGEDCKRYTADAMKFAHRSEVDAVVIGSSWFLYLTNFDRITGVGDIASLNSGAAGALEDLKHSIVDLEAAGKRVYLILPAPFGPQFDPHQMIRRTFKSPAFRLEAAAPTVKGIDALSKPVAVRLREISAGTTTVLIDPTKWLCNETVCPTVVTDGRPIYRDMIHISPWYARERLRFLDQVVLENPSKDSARHGLRANSP